MAKQPLPADTIAALVKRMQGLSMPKGTWEATAGDLARHNDIVREIADERLDFFDMPGGFARKLKEGAKSGDGK